MKIKTRHLKMIDKTYCWSGRNFTIQNIQHVSGDKFIVTTAEGDYTVSEEELDKDFLPVESEEQTNLNQTMLQIANRESDQMRKLSDILMSNIQKVQEDPGFIDKARAINESAKNLIELKKTQIEMFKLLKG